MSLWSPAKTTVVNRKSRRRNFADRFVLIHLH